MANHLSAIDLRKPQIFAGTAIQPLFQFLQLQQT
ncbi:Uncharacterised protein [Vibrio cholerae]|nr:Uncharacterised protein [Vibrio cholerae]